jgi:hypothetical protein
MANWSNPLLTSTYTNFVTEIKDRDTDLALQFDGTTSSNIPTNAIRWNSSVNRWQKWNGSSWAELTSTYALTGLSTTSNATIGGTLGSGAITSTGSVTGTALIPSGSSAPTNGLYLAGSNIIGLATNSAGRVFIDAAGEVGIGTATPGTCLDVTLATASATVGNIRIAPSSAGQARYHLFNGGGIAEWLFGQKTGSSHNFILSKSVAGSESDYLTVDTAGRVGIGTLSPASGLHVLEDGNAQINISATNAGSNSAGISFENQGQRNWQIWADRATDQFRIGNNSRGSTNLAINSSGNLGLGTTAPYSRFTVVPSSTPSTPATANQITVGESSGNGAYRLQLGYLYDTLGRGSIQAYDNGNASPLILNGAGGNVGIGTSSPSYILDLNSGGATPAQIGTTVNWNFPGFILRRNASNVSTAKMLSMMLQGDTDSDTTLTNHLNIWGTYSAAPTTGSTTAGLSGVLNIGAPSGIAAHVNGSQRWIVTSAGRFGLGTTAPGTSFDVALAAPSATIGNIRITPSSPGQARYHLYNGGATAEWVFGQATSTSHDFTFSKSVGGSESEYLRIGASGQIGIGGANYGTSGQVLTSNGSGASPSWTTVTALTAGTAVSATGTAVDFTGIPSSAKRITVMIDAVSTDATATLAVQLGDSGGIETSGYTGGLAWTGPNTGSSGSASTFPLAVGAASDTVSGHAVITKVSGNTWVLSSTVARDNDDLVFISGGSKGLSATLDRIRITTTGGSASFDAGTVNILYE